MKKKNTAGKRLSLSRETLTVLEANSLEGLAGGAVGCGESRVICSIIHTCVSCVNTDNTCA